MQNPENSGPVRVAQEEEVRIAWWKQIPSARRLVLFSLVTFVLALAALAGGFTYMQVLPENGGQNFLFGPGGLYETFTRTPGERAFQGRARMNILCLGIDYNYDERGIHYTKGARSDTIFVISVDAQGRTLNVLSIPRDTQVLINEEIGYDKINAAYSYGGIEQAKATVSNFLGIPIDHFVIVRVSGARKLVDAIGGLHVEVEKKMDYDDNWGNLHIHLEKGPQVLNGEQAVGYARFRMDEEGDRGRIRRQQQIMEALVRRLKDPMVVLRLQALVKAVKENVETDFSVLDMLDLTYLYKDFDRTRMKTGVIVGDDADINGVSYIIPYAPENNRIVMELLKEPSDFSRQDLRIEVLNGSGDEAAVGEVAEALRREGFQVARVAQADRSDHVSTIVIDRRGSVAVRSAMESLLRGALYERDVREESPGQYDVTIIVGRDRLEEVPSFSFPPPSYPRYNPEPVEPSPEPEDPETSRSEPEWEEPIPPEGAEEPALEPEEPGAPVLEPEPPLDQPDPPPARPAPPAARPSTPAPAPIETSVPAPAPPPAPVPTAEPLVTPQPEPTSAEM
ncbi:MAG: LCP family protein [Candidatus Xenobium sp.]|jgi:LCP family protein required for cell wall assembly|nr:LCP family protein [Burkholderiales bacterium]